MKEREMEDYLDDNFVIPDEIKKMSKEELRKAIIKLEKELGCKYLSTFD